VYKRQAMRNIVLIAFSSSVDVVLLISLYR
jgi:hypothetical protein